jgi:hypothetical protein
VAGVGSLLEHAPATINTTNEATLLVLSNIASPEFAR